MQIVGFDFWIQNWHILKPEPAILSYKHTTTYIYLQEQDTLGDAEDRCTQLMHQKVQMEESVQVICVFISWY